MITLRKGSVVQRWFLFIASWSSEDDAYIHQEQTNLCFFLRTLIIKAPLMVVLFVTMGPIVLAAACLVEVWYWLKSFRRESKLTSYKSLQPSKIRVIYDTVHGKICPTVTFE